MQKASVNLRKICSILTLSVVICSWFGSVFARGLPGEYYISQRWRDLFVGISPTTNPAFITEANYPSLRLALCPTLENSFLLMEGGYIHPIMLYHSVAFSYMSLSARDKVAETKWNETTNKLEPTGREYSDFHNMYVFSYAINPWDRLSVGINANVYHLSNFEDPIMGVGVDLGMTYRLMRNPLIGDHIFGIAAQNLVSPNIKKPGEINKNSANLKISWLAKMWEKRVDAGLDVNVKDFMAKGSDFVNNTKNMEIDVNARFGVWLLHMFNLYAHAGVNKKQMPEYIGFTGGMNIPTVNDGRDIQVAYQWMSIIDGLDINTTQTLYGRIDILKHREEVYARRMARLASIGPGDLYNRARTFLSEGKYWDAFFLFGKIYVEYPDFFKNDYVRLFMGQCQEELDMREFSLENYEETKKLFPRSVVVPMADLGIMRLHYRDNNSAGVANQFAKLNSPSVPDSLKFHAYYYQGLQNLRDNDFQNAIQMFSLIPDNHPEYPFAQHSLATAYALANNVSRAIEALDNVVRYTPRTKEAQEIQNRSLVFLGYIFFEGMDGQERALSKAVTALRKVPNTSFYYEDALLGLAWTALRANQWNDCIAAAKELQSISTKTVNQCEAALLEGYCYMVDKKYTEAVNVLGPANDKIVAYKAPSDEEKAEAKTGYDDNRGNYYDLASKVNELALTSQSSFVIQQIDSLKGPQVDYQGKLKDYYKFNDDFARRSFFSKNASQVKEDLDYALANAQKMLGQKSTEKIIDKTKKKSQEIDSEMQKIQDELKKLQKKGKSSTDEEGEEEFEE
ncbi:MAG: hypothetical protein JW795_18035 [Chitinivibrionales bacterium]|nr:hypothetical protein [Chitinivibrionales bacterium]